MNDDNILRQRHKAMERATLGNPYSAKDFQLEVLDRLAEMQSFAEALDESWNKKLQAVKEQRLLKFGSRTLRWRQSRSRLRGTCPGCAKFLETGYGNRGDEGTRAATGADRDDEYGGEDSDRSSLGELRDGQNEIKTLIQAHDSASRKGSARK